MRYQQAAAAALVNQRARAACPFVFQRRVASKERDAEPKMDAVVRVRSRG